MAVRIVRGDVVDRRTLCQMLGGAAMLCLAGAGHVAAGATEPVGTVLTYDVVTTRSLMEIRNGKPAGIPDGVEFVSRTSVTVLSKSPGGGMWFSVLSSSQPSVPPGVEKPPPAVPGIQLYEMSPSGQLKQEFALGADFATAAFAGIVSQGSSKARGRGEKGAVGVKFDELQVSVYYDLAEAEKTESGEVRRLTAPLSEVRRRPFPAIVRSADGAIESAGGGAVFATSASIHAILEVGNPQGRQMVTGLETAGRRVGEAYNIDEQQAAALLAELQGGNRLTRQISDVAQNPLPEKIAEARAAVERHMKSFPGGVLSGYLTEGLRQLEIVGKVSAAKESLQAGKPAPDLAARTVDDQKFRLADFKGSVVLLDFWATWCPPCRADTPKLKELHEKFRNDLVIVGVASDEEKGALMDYIKEHDVTWRQVHEPEPDGAWKMAFGVEGFPTYVLVNRDGSIAGAGLRGEELWDAVEKLAGKK